MANWKEGRVKSNCGWSFFGCVSVSQTYSIPIPLGGGGKGTAANIAGELSICKISCRPYCTTM